MLLKRVNSSFKECHYADDGGPSETSVHGHWTAWRHVPQDT